MKQSRAPITLTTDFGYRDEYVGVMKGVILSINKEIPIVDLVHDVAPQDICQAARIIENNYNYFPTGTVHIAIVDPGVGSTRRILAIQENGHFFIGPDNGIFSPILERENTLDVFSIENRALFLKKISTTFHGRDIMAPVAARLASGMPITRVGPKIHRETCHLIKLRDPVLQSNGIAGEVVSIDRFGNIRTNITNTCLEKLHVEQKPEITIKSYVLGFSEGSYATLEDDKPTALINSSNEIEISVKNKSAAKLLNVKKGERIFIRGHLA
ncbi:MAG: hypothetical protein CR981_03300 [Proteobacteria bacterium]|nr:MAG: hypothetical protein CR981_03300 [Pseudomonadota bacterium]